MTFAKIHTYIPFNKLLRLIIGMAVIIQLIVISYNHYTGYHELHGIAAFAIRLLRGIFYSILAGFAISYPDLIVILFLNKNIPWNKGAFKRAFLQFTLMLLIAFSVAASLTTFAHWVNPYPQGLPNVLFNNILIYAVVNAFFMSIMEAWIYLDESRKEKEKSEKLKQRLITEAASRAHYEAQIQIEEEKNKYAQKLIDQEKKLNSHLEKEIKKRAAITQQLNDSRQQLNSILSNLPGAAYRCLFDHQFTMKYISEKIYEISGYHAGELIENHRQTFAGIIYPEDQDRCRQTIQNALFQKSSYEFEYRLVHKNGQVVWINENGKGIFDESGELIFLDGIIIDVSKRKEAELAAAESERNYKELTDLLPQPIFELDIDGNILFLNKSGEKFFGLTISENPGKTISALPFLVEEDVPQTIEVIRKSSQGKIINPIESAVKRADDSLCPVLIYGSPIIRNERVIGLRGIIIDISERKKQELKLLQAKEELERINNTLEQSVAERTKQLTEANTQLLKVQKENLQSQFEVLKQQVNPHFLFNSLNVLTSLIKIDPDLAESFTERLSKVYRYVLENKEKDLVSLKTELEFLNAYLFLLEIRFMNKLIAEIQIDNRYSDYHILPLAIQLIIENAVKHNTFSKTRPLRIRIFVDDQHQLNIINNLNLRETKLISTGVGLENISRRYALVSDLNPEFIKSEDQFTAKLPLLKIEKSEIA